MFFSEEVLKCITGFGTGKGGSGSVSSAITGSVTSNRLKIRTGRDYG